ncbi:hypothetical protein [Actinomadura rudentiformis]|uniref:Uncharacterized protein n=1 Tax=Actinomadura rudentiformis TaxID=359158 RepID=A0A6H9YQE7_9ACTN|nr:hypothetical protein [Actinomadura rudentiformis]KAB2347368.1 hypothetical protein F8566_20360 [Actinomadura rudentiformis]
MRPLLAALLLAVVLAGCSGDDSPPQVDGSARTACEHLAKAAQARTAGGYKAEYSTDGVKAIEAAMTSKAQGVRDIMRDYDDPSDQIAVEGKLRAWCQAHGMAAG